MTQKQESEKNSDAVAQPVRDRLASIDVIATDYDRTLTGLDLILRPETIRAIDMATKNGIGIVIVSGRGLRFMSRLSHMFARVDALVAENGAVVMFDGVIRRLSPRTGDIIAEKLAEKRVPFIKGEVISYIEKGSLHLAEKAVVEMSDYARLVRNIDSGMVLPADVDKDAGLKVALQLMGRKVERTLVVGDGENDMSLFTLGSLKVALDNSVPQLKERADIVLDSAGGEGVVEIVNRLLRSRGS